MSQINTAVESGNRKRISWVDIAKGIMILVVLIGHTVRKGIRGSLLRGAIYSFHMPFFFLISSYTFRFSESREQLKKKAKRSARMLLLPAMVTIILRILYDNMNNPANLISKQFIKDTLGSLFFASGVNSYLLGWDIPAMGMPWFFVALFFGKLIYDYLHLTLPEKFFVPGVIVTSIAGMLVPRIHTLPFSLDIAMAIQIYFLFGTFLKTRDIEKHLMLKLPASIVIWLGTLYMTFPDYTKWTYLELATRRYTLFPVCYICAVAGTMMIIYISVILDKNKLINSFFSWVGRNSMYMLCIHIIDYFWRQFFWLPERQLVSSALRVIADLIALFIFMTIKTVFDRKRNKVKA